MAYDYGLNEVVLFGGYSTSRLGDTWTYKGGNWTNITSSLPQSPTPRYYGVMAYDSADGYLVLIGGSTSNYIMSNQTWYFTGSDWVKATAIPWMNWRGGDLYGPEMAYDPSLGEVVLTGIDYGAIYGYHAGNWSNIMGNDPCDIYDPLAYDSADGYLVSVGGNSSYMTCKLTGSGWSLVPSITEPPLGGYSKMAYDDGAQAIIFPLSKIFPASCYTPFSCSQTWGFNGGNWTNITSLSALEPSGRAGAAVAYDAADGYTVFFGGANESVMLGDTWTLKVLTTHVPTYPVTFSESGLATGTQWSVTLNGIVNTSTTTSMEFSEPNGTYAFSVTPVSGYSTSISAGNISVSGTSPAPISVTFYPLPITSVAISPTTPSLNYGATQVFTATPTCSATCPASGITYSWTLTNSAMGSLNTTTGPAVSFTAGYSQGIVALFVNATLSATTVQSNPADISINSGNSTLAINSFTASPNPVTVDELTNLSVSASGGTGALTYVYTGLPPGCTTSDTTRLNCFPSATGVFTVRVFVNDSASHSVNATLSLVVNPSGTLYLVSLSPALPTITTGNTVDFTATPWCSYTCPSNVSYSWSLTNPTLGSLTLGGGPTVSFYAGSIAETGGIFVNATLDGVTLENSTVITLTTSTTVLTSLSLSPISPAVSTGGTQPFSATPTCNNTCPSGITYAWSLSSATLGALSGSATSVTFYAGTVAGTVGIFVNATLGAITKEAATVITVVLASNSTLVSVAISPASVAIQESGSVPFTAIPACTSTCPAGTLYLWALTSGLGTLNAASGNTVIFYAGDTSGTLGLFVNGTLNGRTVSSSPAIITITNSNPLTIDSFIASPAAIDLGVTTYLNVTASNGSSPYTYSYFGLPAGCNTANTNSLSCDPVVSGSFDITVNVTDALGTERTLSTGLVVTYGPNVQLVPDRYDVDVGETLFMHTLVTGGTEPFTFSYTAFGPNANSGCTFSNAAELKCTPTGIGSFYVQVNVVDRYGMSTAAPSPTIEVVPALQVTLSATSSTVNLGETVAFVANASGGMGPYTYSYSGLPPGCVSVNSTSVGCLPTQAGSYVATVQVRDGDNATANSSVSLKVLFDFIVTAPTTVQLGQQVQLVIKAEGGYGTLTYSYIGLPPGCSSEDTPALNCTPTVAGLYNITISVHDQVGNHASHSVLLTVSPASPSPAGVLGLTTMEWVVVITCIVAAVAIILATMVARNRMTRTDALGGTYARSGRTTHMSSYEEYGKKPAAPARPAGAPSKGEKPAPEIGLDDLL
jgi:hypothetical protein